MMSAFRMLLAALLCVVMAGCGGPTSSGDDVSTKSRADAEAELRQKPSFEQAQPVYRDAVRQMADGVAALVPGMTWQFYEDSWSGCDPPYVHTSGVVVYVAVSFDKPFPDDVWPAALDMVTAGAAKLGITDRGKLIDSAGHHDISITGHGGIVQFATYKASTLTAQSDCRMRETPQ